MRTFNLDEEGFRRTWDFLVNREEDIALDIEDFGELKWLFFSIVGSEPKRVPEKDTETKKP